MRAIDADAIISQCEEYSNLLKYDGTTDREWAVVKRIILIIKEQPTIEPERKNGKWLPDNNSVYEMRFVCSECKESQVVPTIGFTKYKPIWDFCPYCGARMEGK